MNKKVIKPQISQISGKSVSVDSLKKLVTNDVKVEIQNLKAGYGTTEILHNINLFVGEGQSLCLIGPNGAGKSTVLHSIFGFSTIHSGKILIENKETQNLPASAKLTKVGIAYILQDNSVFPNMSVEDNLFLGGFTSKQSKKDLWLRVDEIFEKYPILAKRRKQFAKALSGGERRLLEISRALIMNPKILLVDEPSIGLEPRYIDMIFEILKNLQTNDQKTIIIVEQNAKKGLEFSDLGYVLVAGEVLIADYGNNLLKNEEVGKLFLGVE